MIRYKLIILNLFDIKSHKNKYDINIYMEKIIFEK